MAETKPNLFQYQIDVPASRSYASPRSSGGQQFLC